MTSRLLGVDWGERRTGLAISDPEGRVALPCGVARGNRKDQLERIMTVVREKGPDLIVVGRPLHLSGATGESARRAEVFARRLESRAGVRVVLWDERLSSRQARNSLQDRGLSSRDAATVEDEMAATLILQSYLDHIRAVGAQESDQGHR